MAQQPEMTTKLLDLPLDILVVIFPYLDAKSFLSLCSTCRALYQPSIRFESSYWSHATQSTFRVRNRPVAQADGLRWQRLYKRLLTQSRVYTWGQNSNGCLGRGFNERSFGRITRRGMPTRFGAGRSRQNGRTSWPEEMEGTRELGVIADLQCGGWSTSVLNDKGIISSVGTLNGLTQFHAKTELAPMIFPPGYPSLHERYEPHIAIRQFSSGRTHILGLADDGAIWTWYDLHLPAVEIEFQNMSTTEGGSGKVRTVVAGWNKSSVYIKNIGIVLWDIVEEPRSDETEIDTVQVSEWVIVPKTGYQRPKGSQREPDETTRLLGRDIGEVISYIILEHYVVFVTDLQKAFAARIQWNQESGIVHDSFELLDLQSLSSVDTTPAATDVQGSFRSFSVFKQNGEVITTDQEYLDACSRRAFEMSQDDLPVLTKIPALQHANVISIAFGDYHYHALHSDGSISSYGVEPSGCGALGLGSGMEVGVPAGVLRGIKYNPWNRDGTLLPHAYFRGRRIWFHPDSEKWINFLAARGSDPDEASERSRMCHTVPPVQGEVSEWVEQMGENWDKRPEVIQQDEDGLGAYFALSVAAAGWHSGALVLVNDKLVGAISESCLVDDPGFARSSAVQGSQPSGASSEPDVLARMTTLFSGLLRDVFGLPADTDMDEPSSQSHAPKGKLYSWADQSFPRLQLEHGVEMPGTIPFSEWKQPKPDWKLLWHGDGFTGKVFGVEGWELQEDSA